MVSTVRPVAKFANKFVSSWAKAWEETAKRKFSGYTRLYHPRFYDKKKRRNRRDFLSYKRMVGKKLKWIRVRTRHVKVVWKKTNKKRRTIQFLQQYECPSLFDVGRKTLTLLRHRGKWKIYREVWKRDAKAELYARWNKSWRNTKPKARSWEHPVDNGNGPAVVTLEVTAVGRKLKSLSCSGGPDGNSTSVHISLFKNQRFFSFVEQSEGSEVHRTTYYFSNNGRYNKKFSISTCVGICGEVHDSAPKNVPKAPAYSKKVLKQLKAKLNQLKSVWKQAKKTGRIPKSFTCWK